MSANRADVLPAARWSTVGCDLAFLWFALCSSACAFCFARVSIFLAQRRSRRGSSYESGSSRRTSLRAASASM
jgi:hypothetical protein